MIGSRRHAATRSLIVRRGVLWTCTFISIYGLVILFLPSFIGDDTWRQFVALPVNLIAALLGLSLINYGLRAWRWIYLSRLSGLYVPNAANLVYYLAGYAFTATPGKAGEAIRLLFLKKGHGVRLSLSLPLMIADRALDLWGVALLICLGLASLAGLQTYALALLIILILLSLPMMAPLSFRNLGRPICRQLGMRRQVRVRQVVRILERFAGWRGYGLMLVPSALGWLAEGVALWLLLLALGADIALLHAASMFCLSMIIGALTLLPGGLVGAEVTLVAMLNTAGVDLKTAVVATAVIRLTTFWFAVVLGAILFPLAVRFAGAYQSGDK
jgi:uncharacterized protein (TIRG00374 family)